MRQFITAKVHRITVTDASLDYIGSITVSREILQAADMLPYERVHVVNLTTGSRWDTYILPTDEPGTFTLNGGGARLGQIGDQCVLMTYTWAEQFTGASAVFCDENNKPNHTAIW